MHAWYGRSCAAVIRCTMPTKEERALARRLFKCDCILANAKAFQDLFWAVMKATHGTLFEAVGTQGRKGDGGNDGYLPRDKHYYQLYAPLNPKEKAGAAARKLATDFALIMKQWGGDGGRSIMEFTFVYNDKYEGMPKDISLCLKDLREKNSEMAFTAYGAPDLETDFMLLEDTEWDRILGAPVPDPERIGIIDYSVLGEVVRFVLSRDIDEEETRIVLPPTLDEKIALNKLSAINALRVKNGALYTGHVERYFQLNSAFALGELRDHVVGVYEAAKLAVSLTKSEAGSDVDDVFKLFRRSLFPKSAVTGTGLAVDAIIGFFFEACDVFDPNPKSKGLPGATP